MHLSVSWSVGLLTNVRKLSRLVSHTKMTRKYWFIQKIQVTSFRFDKLAESFVFEATLRNEDQFSMFIPKF